MDHVHAASARQMPSPDLIHEGLAAAGESIAQALGQMPEQPATARQRPAPAPRYGYVPSLLPGIPLYAGGK